MSQEYPPETGWGGIGSYVHEMAAALAIRGHYIVVLSRALERESDEVNGGLHVYRILPRKGLGSVRFFWRFQRFWDGYRYAVAKKLDEIVREHRIDIIEAPEARGETCYYQLTRHRRPAVVVKLHTPRWLVDKLARNSPALWNRFEYFAEKMTIQKADVVYSCSRALLDAGKEFFPKRDYAVVHNPIALSQGLPPKEDDGKTVLFVGRLEWRKGVQVFGKVIPQVLERIKGARFVFLGPDSSWHGGDSLKEFIVDQIPEEMKGSLIFAGGVSRQDVLDHLRRAAVCVLPSLWENFPYTCLEAMACGCSVVGSRNGGMAEMIEDGVSGILIDPEKPEGISDAIVMLLNDGNLRKRMGESAVARISELFLTDRIVDQTLEIYRRAIEIHDQKKSSQ